MIANSRLAAALVLAALAACARPVPTPLAPAASGTGSAAGGSAAGSGRGDDACTGVESLADGSSCEGPLCAPRERVALACELRDEMEERYVFLSVKSRLLAGPGRTPFDSRRHLDACVDAERAIEREADPLRFYDRMRRCTAAFEDGHLVLSVPRRLPAVALGIGLRLAADGRVYVASRTPGLLAWLDETGRTPGAREALAVGNEVLAIDGAPVVAALDELGRHVPASSADARRERAVDALTRRDFAYPRTGVATLILFDGRGLREVRLPWFVAPGADAHPITRAWVERTGAGTTDLLDWRTDPKAAWARDAAAATDGVLRGDSILPPEAQARLTEYRGDGGLLAARLGEFEGTIGTPFCYAQLLSFHTDKLAAPGAAKRPLVEVLGEFVRGCAASGRDLVLDLRQNEGGYISHSNAIAAMLTPRDRTSPGGVLLLRATARNEGVYAERAPDGGTGFFGRARSEPERILEAIRRAREAREEFTPAFLDAPLGPSASVGGFDGKVVALVSPSCMSVCDRLAGILRSSGRALLVGSPTEGAGGSQQEARGLSARWTDRGGRLAVAIPNAAMGVQVVAEGAPDTSVGRFFEALAFENRPVAPHVGYATTLADLERHNAGWLAAAEAALAAGDGATASR